MSRIVIASAAKFETDELMVELCRLGIDATQLVVGVGSTQAAILAARLREVVAGRDVVFCCTGGILGAFDEVAVYQAKVVRFNPSDVRHGQSYIVAGSEPSIDTTGLPFLLPACEISGSGSISLLPENYESITPKIETLELYSVARAWSPWVKTLTGIVAVTNSVGPKAHFDWKENFRLASSKTATSVAAEILNMKERWV